MSFTHVTGPEYLDPTLLILQKQACFPHSSELASDRNKYVKCFSQTLTLKQPLKQNQLFIILLGWLNIKPGTSCLYKAKS